MKERWVEVAPDVAEKQEVVPAQIAIYKGLTLLKKGEDIQAAINSFDKAAQLDPSLTQTVKYQKAIANMQLENLHIHYPALEDLQGVCHNGMR